VITLFLPLSLLGVSLGQRLTQSVHDGSANLRIGLGVLPVALSFLIAEGVAGALVGRFGGRANASDAALAGAFGAFICWLMAALSGALTPWLVALAALFVLVLGGAGAAFIGARLGRTRRV